MPIIYFTFTPHQNKLQCSCIVTMMKFIRILMLSVVVFGGVLSSEVENSFNRALYEKWSVLSGVLNKDLTSVYAPVSSDVSDVCRKHSLLYADQVKKGVPWAVRMLDSSSKIPAGILMGNIVQLGNYDECVQIEDIASDFGKFSGQHCMVLVGQHGEEQKKIRAQRQMMYSEDNVGAPNTYSLGVRLSLCVPSSCRPSDVTSHLQSVFRNLSVRVDDVTCSSRATEQAFTTADWAAIGFCLLVLLLVFLSTAYDAYTHKDAECDRSLLTSFSLSSNFRRLVSRSTGPDNIPVLEGLRFLNMVWVVGSHRSMIVLTIPSHNINSIGDIMSDWSHITITNPTLSVDSFLLVSGLLVSYNFLRDMEAGKSFSLARHYLHRYIRLTPAYAATILLTATLMTHAGEGPSWGFNMAAIQESCEATWWSSLLYINNYVNPRYTCLLQSWYLDVDMQLFWLSPLILYPLWRWPRVGKALCGVLVSAGIVIAFLVPYAYKLRFSTLISCQEFVKMYLPTHTRFTPWLIGVGLGYVLHKTKKRTLHMSTALVAVGWLLSAVLMSTSLLFAHRFIQPDHQYERVLESLYLCLMRPAWALGLAWIVFACSKGYGGSTNDFLSCRMFQILGRLSFTIFLTHFSILHWIEASTKTAEFITDRESIVRYCGDLTFSITAGFILTLLVEAPCVSVEKYVMGKFSSSSSEKKTIKEVDVSI